jgi:hypothetical protein
MRLLTGSLWVLVVVILAIGGCNDVYTPPEMVEVRLTVAGEHEGEPIALEGANVCQMDTDTPNCVPTNANGSATLELPANQQLSYTVEKEGYGSLLYPVVMAATSANLDANMATNEELSQQYANLDSVYPPRETGTIRIIFSPRFAGATVRLVDATAEEWYRDEEGNWRAPPDVEATTEGEGCCGSGGFVEVGPGTFQVEIGGTAQGCAVTRNSGTLRGWPGEASNTVQVPVREGFETRTVVSCPVPL